MASPTLVRVGHGRHPLVVVDEATGDVDRVAALARSMAPFPPSPGNFYPGARRRFGADDGPANAYVDALCNAIAPYVAGAFDAMRFTLIEASFSTVATARGALLPMQRAPHVDTTDPAQLAVLHYVSLPGPSGTGFFRQRATGIEKVDDGNYDRFVAAARAAAAMLPGDAAYIQGDDAGYEMVHAVDARPDRLLVYPSALLHSGLIPPDLPLDAHPAAGRLTANIFIRLDA